MQELLADEVALLPRQRGERHDLLGHRPLLLQRECDGRHRVGELRARSLDPRDRHGLVGVEQVLDDHHRVVSLLDRLPVEVRGQLRQRLRVVVHGDRHVLLRRAELARDLLVQLGGKPPHRGDSNGRSPD